MTFRSQHKRVLGGKELNYRRHNTYIAILTHSARTLRKRYYAGYNTIKVMDLYNESLKKVIRNGWIHGAPIEIPDSGHMAKYKKDIVKFCTYMGFMKEGTTIYSDMLDFTPYINSTDYT